MSRKSINVATFHHGDAPIPAASRVGNIVYTGAISGYDVQTRQHVDGLEAQARLMFMHLRDVLLAACARPEDVVRMTFFVKSPEARAAINAEWVALFPDPDSRPARHILNYEPPKGALMQCDAVAVIT